MADYDCESEFLERKKLTCCVVYSRYLALPMTTGAIYLKLDYSLRT